MPLFWTELDYLLGLILWSLGLLALAGLLVKRRQQWRRRQLLTRGRSVLLGSLLACWSLLALVTCLEWVFVLAVDHSDAFNGTNVSKRWYRRFMDANRNDDGFRDRHTLAEPTPDGVRRLIVFGDSYVAGHGVRNMDDRFTERLERDFNRDGKFHVRVLNVGEPGYEVSLIEGLMQAVIQKKIPADVFLYCYMLNDIEGYDPRTEEYLREVNQQAPTNPLITKTYFLNWAYFRWQQTRTRGVVNYFPNLEDAYSTKAWTNVAGALERMRVRCEAANIEFRMVLFPFMQNLGPDYNFRPVHQQLIDWCKAHDVPVLDMEPLLSAHHREGLHANAFDAHPNEYAHKLIADAIFEWLKDDPRLQGEGAAAEAPAIRN
ncbi:SGNH/GDSL hydrolase family protein [Planctomicrobium sp. SH664]|uniref:SGNH/GDSL hydrolase family protein n=1 Tax=Planctomicrobium sp. SH664 TaxID=3448125 RepID=UPI003F5B5B76